MEKNIIGIDIGGTKMLLTCVQGEAIVGDVISRKTPDTSEEIMDLIFRGIEELRNKYPVKAIGMASAGTVNLENSKVTGSTGNLPDGYEDIEFKKVIEAKFNIPVLVENDANAAAFAEFKTGNAKGHPNTITLTLGTGIGGGIIIEGKLLKGSTGAGAEVGHMPLTWAKKRKCSCGNWDCWESYASGSGYAITAREMAQEVPSESLQKILDGKSISELSTYDIIRELKNGDAFSIKVHDQWEEFLSMGIASLANIFEPKSIILSGGMAKFVNYKVLHSKVFDRTVISKPKIMPAKFDNFAGILGATYLAKNKFF